MEVIFSRFTDETIVSEVVNRSALHQVSYVMHWAHDNANVGKQFNKL